MSTTKQDNVIQLQQQQTNNEPTLVNSIDENTPTLGELIDKEPLAAPEQEQQKKESVASKFLQEMQGVMIEINDGKTEKIKTQMKKGFIRLEYVTDKGVVKEDLREYSPLTIGKNKKVLKLLKRTRMFTAEIDNENFILEDIKLKYGDIVDEDVTKEDLESEEMRREIITNYVIAQKAKIYFDIDNIENYTVSDLILLIGLFEIRNNLTPY